MKEYQTLADYTAHKKAVEFVNEFKASNKHLKFKSILQTEEQKKLKIRHLKRA